MAKKLYGAAAAAHKARLAKSQRSSGTRAMTRTKTRYVTRTRTVGASGGARPRRRRSGGGSMKMTHLAIASAGLAYLTGQNAPVAFIRDNAAKIPGAKTFGTPAALGVACLAVDRFIKPNKWLKLAGTAGIVLAAVRLGEQGKSFKWVGDGGYDMSGDDDMSDIDGDDDIGDDE